MRNLTSLSNYFECSGSCTLDWPLKAARRDENNERNKNQRISRFVKVELNWTICSFENRRVEPV